MIQWIITSSVLILIVMLLRFLLRGKISLKLQYALWGIVLIRLLVPVALFESSFSVMNILPKTTEKISDVYIENDDEHDYSEISETNTLLQYEDDGFVYFEHDSGALPNVDGDEISIPKEQTFKFPEITLEGIWVLGVAMAAMALLASNITFTAQLKRTKQPVKVENASLPVYFSPAIITPCTFGIFKPSIYVTEAALSDEKTFSHVIAHETTHLKHRDNIWAVLRCVALALHWYNPLVWAAAFLSLRDAELACDEDTIKSIGEEERLDYGRTLISLTTKKPMAGIMSTATTMAGSKSSIKERIMLIAKKPKVLKIAVAVLILAVAVAMVVTFSSPLMKESEEKETVISESTYGSCVERDGKFYVLDLDGNITGGPFDTMEYYSPEDGGKFIVFSNIGENNRREIVFNSGNRAEWIETEDIRYTLYQMNFRKVNDIPFTSYYSYGYDPTTGAELSGVSDGVQYGYVFDRKTATYSLQSKAGDYTDFVSGNYDENNLVKSGDYYLLPYYYNANIFRPVFGLGDKNGNVILEPRYNNISVLSGDRFLVREGEGAEQGDICGRSYIVDLTGKKLGNEYNDLEYIQLTNGWFIGIAKSCGAESEVELLDALGNRMQMGYWFVDINGVAVSEQMQEIRVSDECFVNKDGKRLLDANSSVDVLSLKDAWISVSVDSYTFDIGKISDTREPNGYDIKNDPLFTFDANGLKPDKEKLSYMDGEYEKWSVVYPSANIEKQIFTDKTVAGKISNTISRFSTELTWLDFTGISGKIDMIENEKLLYIALSNTPTLFFPVDFGEKVIFRDKSIETMNIGKLIENAAEHGVCITEIRYADDVEKTFHMIFGNEVQFVPENIEFARWRYVEELGVFVTDSESINHANRNITQMVVEISEEKDGVYTVEAVPVIAFSEDGKDVIYNFPEMDTKITESNKDILLKGDHYLFTVKEENSRFIIKEFSVRNNDKTIAKTDVSNMVSSGIHVGAVLPFDKFVYPTIKEERLATEENIEDHENALSDFALVSRIEITETADDISRNLTGAEVKRIRDILSTAELEIFDEHPNPNTGGALFIRGVKKNGKALWTLCYDFGNMVRICLDGETNYAFKIDKDAFRGIREIIESSEAEKAKPNVYALGNISLYSGDGKYFYDYGEYTEQYGFDFSNTIYDEAIETKAEYLGGKLKTVKTVEIVDKTDGTKFNINLYEFGFTLDGSAVEKMKTEGKNFAEAYTMDSFIWRNAVTGIEENYLSAEDYGICWLGLIQPKRVESITVKDSVTGSEEKFTHDGNHDEIAPIVDILRNLKAADEGHPYKNLGKISVNIKFKTGISYNIEYYDGAIEIYADDLKKSVSYYVKDFKDAYNALLQYALGEYEYNYIVG